MTKTFLKHSGIFSVLLVALSFLTVSSCKDDEPEPNNNNTTSQYSMIATVDLGGEFEVKADVVFTLMTSTFEATVTTTEIAGQPEEHTTMLTGTRDGDNLTLSANQVFNVTPPGGDEEKVTIKSGTITLSGNTLTGSGVMEVDFQDGSDPIEGNFSATGTKK